jgi:hypothetical protein
VDSSIDHCSRLFSMLYSNTLVQAVQSILIVSAHTREGVPLSWPVMLTLQLAPLQVGEEGAPTGSRPTDAPTRGERGPVFLDEPGSGAAGAQVRPPPCPSGMQHHGFEQHPCSAPGNVLYALMWMMAGRYSALLSAAVVFCADGVIAAQQMTQGSAGMVGGRPTDAPTRGERGPVFTDEPAPGATQGQVWRMHCRLSLPKLLWMFVILMMHSVLHEQVRGCVGGVLAYFEVSCNETCCAEATAQPCLRFERAQAPCVWKKHPINTLRKSVVNVCFCRTGTAEIKLEGPRHRHCHQDH